MWTSRWWSYIQVRPGLLGSVFCLMIIQSKLPKKSSTVTPVILSTDKTQLTQFSGSKQAYPVYLTLGNIPNHLRRKPSQQACILVAYLPVEKYSKGQFSKQEHSARYQRLFHRAMRIIVEPLITAGKDGVEMASGNGEVRLVHPILASYVANFPEQCLVTCSKYGTCPKCRVASDSLQDASASPLQTQAWTLGVMHAARESTDSESKYFKHCMREEVSGYVHQPFWADLPYTDIHFCITPDVLHQLYQGVLKHLISWCQILLTKEELDRRIRCLPYAVGLRHFKNGISALSQISGTERKNMGKILLGCLVGTRISGKGIAACRAILDFIYLAQDRHRRRPQDRRRLTQQHRRQLQDHRRRQPQDHHCRLQQTSQTLPPNCRCTLSLRLFHYPYTQLAPINRFCLFRSNTMPPCFLRTSRNILLFTRSHHRTTPPTSPFLLLASTSTTPSNSASKVSTITQMR